MMDILNIKSASILGISQGGMIAQKLAIVEENYNFLSGTPLYQTNIDSCLHVLSCKPENLKTTYSYVLGNYGLDYININTSILRVTVSRIQDVESIMSGNFSKRDILNVATTSVGFDTLKEKVVNLKLM